MVIVPSLIAALAACAAGEDKSPPAKAADPMASFARLAPGEWRVTFRSGTSFFHTWHWGPGKHSLRRMTDGSGAGGEPWRAVQVFYWHPGHKQVRVLGVEPVARGVAEGTITFEGDAADGVFDLVQLDMKGYEGDRVVPYVVRLDFEKDGALRQRVWSVQGADRTLLLDLHHQKIESKPD